MRKTVAVLLLGVMLFSSTYLGADTSNDVTAQPVIPKSNYITHTPIRINSNAEFASMAASEGWPGDGTPRNPYIIKDYIIDQTAAPNIEIWDTTVYFIIQNCFLNGSTNRFWRVRNFIISNCTATNSGSEGIFIQDGQNVRIDNCLCYDNNAGLEFNFGLGNITCFNNSLFDNEYSNLYLNGYGDHKANWDFRIDTTNTVNGLPVYYFFDVQNEVFDSLVGGYIHFAWCSNITAKNCRVPNGDGLKLNAVDNSTIYNYSSFGSSDWRNVCIRNTYDSTIDNSSILSNERDGMFIQDSNRNKIIHCNISDNGKDGIGFSRALENIISSCNIESNLGFGVRITSTDVANNIFYHNDFINNGCQAYDKQSTNIWDNGYPSGGNYWSDYTGTDIYSGPNQDQPGSDGMGDTPYIFDSYNQDNYPLMEPWGADATPPTIISTTPANNETNVDVNSEIVVLFSEPMNQTSAESAFHIYPNVNGIFSWNAAGNEMTFTPSEPMMELKQFLVHINLSASDLAGNFVVSNEGAEIPICIKPASQNQAAIYNDLIVWEDRRNGEYDIYMYNVSNGTEIPICTHPALQYHPEISDNKIVWFDNRNGNWDIYMYDLNTNTETPICTNLTKQISPDIYGNRIVWEDYRNYISGTNVDIYMYDLSTNTETQITTDVANQMDPIIYDDKIVWLDYRFVNPYTPDIFMYNISTSSETPICIDPKDQRTPDIYDNKIVWADYRYDNFNIYMFDLSTNTEVPICLQSGVQHSPTIYKDKLIWVDDRPVENDTKNNIFVYNMTTCTETTLFPNITIQSKPIIYGDFITWADYSNQGSTYSDIYLYCLPHAWTFTTGEGEENPAAATATGPQGAGHDPVITITYTWTGTPSQVDLFYSTNHGDSWNYLATDDTVDGTYDWTPQSGNCPKPHKFYWIANAKGGTDDVGIPANGTDPEAGPYNWKTFDVNTGSGGPERETGSGYWTFVSVPLTVSGDVTEVFDDALYGDGGTTWDYAMWYDASDPVKQWKSYNIIRPESLNDELSIDNTKGIWLHITSNSGDGVLTAGSGLVPSSTSIQLKAGWNMVGYPTLNDTMTVGNALWGTGADKVEVFDPSDPYMTKEIGPTYLMMPGEAYWIHVPADSVWIVNW